MKVHELYGKTPSPSKMVSIIDVSMSINSIDSNVGMSSIILPSVPSPLPQGRIHYNLFTSSTLEILCNAAMFYFAHKKSLNYPPIASQNVMMSEDYLNTSHLENL
jgi:hypothetical protein